jgi:hypothetical protein
MTLSPKDKWRLFAHDPADLFSKFSKLGLRIPGRSEPKNQFAEEMYCIRRYLFPLAHKSLLQFPLQVTKSEAPDFMLTELGGVSVGLEVTKATRQEFEADLTRVARKQKTTHFESDPDAGMMDLTSTGWIDSAREAELIEYIVSSVTNKRENLNSYSVGQCDLLIYDNTPILGPNLTMVAETVRLKLSTSPLFNKDGRSFRVVSVIRDHWLIYDIARAPRMLAYNPKWDVSI